MNASDLRFVALAACAAYLASPPPSAARAAPRTEEEVVFERADPARILEFPRDHFAHERTAIEWWYLTGHLEASGGRSFGYQFTIFRVGLVPDPPASDSSFAASALVMGHAAITDLDRGRHRFAEVIHRACPLLGGFSEDPRGDGRIAWCRAAPGTDGEWSVTWNGEAFDVAMRDDDKGIAMALRTRPERPLVLHGDRGFSRKNATGTSASHYYSFTRLDTSGDLEVDGERMRVTGTSWMDHEFGGDALDDEQVGWDWFSLQLDDGRDLMLYVLRDRDGTAGHRSGTLVFATGEVARLESDAFSLFVLDTWRSDSTATEYPAKWRLHLPALGETLIVEPRVSDQENRSRLVENLRYWEGAVSVIGPDGGRRGRGYVELTGYGENARLPL